MGRNGSGRSTDRVVANDNGAAEAQTAFLTGMKALHSFALATAGEAFRDAQSIDPDFALAYWGEALSYNSPLWAAQDREAAEAAPANVRDARRRWLEDGSTAYRAAWRARIAAVDEKELEAAMALARGDDAAAEALLLEATVLEAKLNAPMGPPLPMKSAYEMYGEFLLGLGRRDEAAAQFASALERMPNRTRSVRGLERAQ